MQTLFKKWILITLIVNFTLQNGYSLMSIPQSKDEWLKLAQQDKVAFTQTFFNALNGKSMDLVDIFYHPQAHFTDPIGEHTGVADIKKYYQGIYGPVTDIRFEFKTPLVAGQELAQEWSMFFKSSKLNGGKEIVVHGLSKIKFDSETHQAIEHRDYFDVGEMVYEHVTVLGMIVRWIKGKLK
jgi:hypothetical protein